jgi:hypothetical protein
MGVKKSTIGGFIGYSSLNLKRILKTPFIYGESGGPTIVAYHIVISSGLFIVIPGIIFFSI